MKNKLISHIREIITHNPTTQKVSTFENLVIHFIMIICVQQLFT